MMESKSKYCKNCESNTQGKYCAECGQKTTIGKVTFKETIQDLFDAIFSIEAPLIATLKMLALNPGKLFKEYLAGKRKKYYKPVTFFILMTVIYLVIRGIIKFDPFGSNLMQVDDPSSSQLLAKAREFFLVNINKLLFAFVFSLGLILKLFFYKKYTLAEFLAVSFYLMAVYTLLTTLNMFYIRFIDASFQAWHIIIMVLYFTYAMISFFEGNKILVTVKSLFAFVLAFYLYGFLGFAFSFLIVWLRYL